MVDAEGATLGPDCFLVRRTAAGYRCVHPAEAAALQKFLFGEADDPDLLFTLSRGIAEALDEGEIALAQIYGLRIPIAGLDSGQLERLAAAAPLIKANFNPEEPRIPAGSPKGGEWTDDGGASPGFPLAAPIGATAAAATEATASIFGTLGRTALAGLTDLAAGMAEPTAFLGVLFLPTNSSLVTEDKLPDHPDLSYRYDRDAGVLEIFRQSDGGRQPAVSGHLGPDGLFYGPNGEVIGRSLGSTAAVDPDALPAPLGQTGVQTSAAAANAENRPQLCPAATGEDITSRSERSIAYQTQITGLPPGLEVKLNGVRFDGCREADGTMLEAKGPGFADKMTGPNDWPDWYRFVREAKEQMDRQAKAAPDRRIEWHFAEPEVAQYFEAYEDRPANIVVLYTPPEQP